MNAQTGRVGAYSYISGKRIFAAFLIAPLMTPVVIVLGEYITGSIQHWRHAAGNFSWYLIFGAYPVTIVAGVPLFFSYRAHNCTNPMYFTAAGGVTGFIVSFLVGRGYEAFSGDWNIQVIVSCTIAGALSALVFRSILFGIGVRPKITSS